MGKMSSPGQLYALGIWTVKSGSESAFISLWDDFANWTAKTQPGPVSSAILLQDLDNPQRFISVGPWEDEASIRAWRGLPEFREFFAKARELCDDIQPRTLRLAAKAEKGAE